MKKIAFALILALPLCAFAQAVDLDELAIRLEATRLQSAVGLVQFRGGFAGYFFQVVNPIVMGDQAKHDFSDIERALRKANTGMHLLAAPAKAAPQSTGDGRALCIKPLKGNAPSAPFWIYLVGNGPVAAEQQKSKFEITDDAANLENLKQTGVLTLCDAA